MDKTDEKYEPLYEAEKFFQELTAEFSQEEKEIYNKVQQRIQQRIEEKNQQTIKDNEQNFHDIMQDKELLSNDPIHSKHITSYEREIVVDLKMEISAINEDGFLKEVAPIVQNYYHIPVPSGYNYVDSVSKFIETLEQNLESFAKKMFRKNEPTELHI